MSKICDRSPPARAARLLAVVAGAVLLLGVAQSAYATTYETANIGFDGYGYVGQAHLRADFSYDDGPGDGGWDVDYWTDTDPYAGPVWTGEYAFLMDWNSSSAQARDLLGGAKDQLVSFSAYCIDLNQNTSNYHVYADYEIRPLEVTPLGGEIGLMGVAKANDIRELFKLYLPLVDTADEAEAFAAAVWEIVYEKPGVQYDLVSELGSAGWLQVTPSSDGVATIAEDWLDYVWANDNPEDRDPNVFALSNSDLQDVALTYPGAGGVNPVWPPPSSIPEPLTMVGVLMGFAGIGAYMVRKRKRA